MAHEAFEYRGHRVLIQTFCDGATWGWRFRISDEPLVELKHSPSTSESEALAEVRSAARSVLDLRGVNA